MNLVRKLGVVLALVVVPMSACSGEKKPVQDLEIGLPSEVQNEDGFVLQCRSTLISQAEKASVYRNTYYSLGTDGTETVQSTVEGPRPCP